METKKLCQCCKKNYAARTYEREKNSQTEFYCLECYDKLFLKERVEENALTSCPYCGMELSEVKKGKLVGCAHCYQTMHSGILPIVQKMQGENKAHTGKTPPLEWAYDTEDSLNPILAEYRAKAVEKARFERQCNELEIIVKKLKSEGDFEGAKSYAEKLSAMKSQSAIEEGFVWRTRRSLSKRS